MGSGMPEIGSRISLISKADIRYEGKLYAVDPEECTIALSSVRSYGTEDRPTNYPVPAQAQVYDFILFRGSDIKDIRVLTTTIPNDPAIVQLSVPPSLHETQFQSQPGYPPPTIASMTMPNVPSTSRQQSFQNAFTAATSGAANVMQSIPKPQPVSNISEDESRSSTPSTQNANITNKNAEPKQNANKDDDYQQRIQKMHGNRDNRTGGQSGNRYQQKPQNKQYSQVTQQGQPQQQQQQRYQQNRYPQQQQKYGQQQSQYRDYNRESYRNYNDYRDPYARQYAQPMRNQQRNENWNYGGQRRGMNRMGQAAGQQNNFQSGGYHNRQQQQGQQQPKNTLKFDADYDFEQANSQFEEVKSKLGKLKIDETATAVKVNGDVEAKKEDSGNEAQSGDENEVEGEDKPIFYDKVKSFFDQISYESIERSKGFNQRVDWKTERKINSETFGTVALRRNNNFRGGGTAGGRPSGNNYYNNYQARNTMNNSYRTGYRSQGNQNRRPQYQAKSADEAGKAN